jgi:hypothetical protein
VLGVGEDAAVVPRGTVRWSAQAAWTAYNELYGPGGQLEPLGAPLSTDSLGVRALTLLRPVQTSLRTLAQMPAANVTLGPVRTDFSARIARSSLVLDVGLTSRIMLTGRLPYEHTISEVVFEANPRGVTSNRANLGVNPALVPTSAAATRNRGVVDSLVRVVAELTTRLAGCAATPADPVCADRARVEALLAEARTFAAGIAETYGNGADTARGSAFVPLAGSTLQTAIANRVAALNTAFKTYIPQLSEWDAPFPAQVSITSAQTQELLGDALEIASIGLIERSHIGDVEAGMKILLIDTFGRSLRERTSASPVALRFALGGLVRFGTGQSDTPDDLADIGTGDGQTDVEVSGSADLLMSRRFWASIVARYGAQLADDQFVRVPDVPRNPFLAAYRLQRVGRDLGDYVELEATPRYVYNDYLSLSAQWSYRRKAEDAYTGSFRVDVDGEPVTLDAGVLGTDTDQTEQRMGGGVSFSTLRAFDRGRARIPMEFQFLHWQTVSGSGYVPKRFTTQVQLRVYTRLFGAPLRPRRPAGPPAPRPGA